MPLKRYRDLRLNDRFNTYCACRMQLVQVVSVPVVDGDRVTCWVKPCTKSGKRSRLTFESDRTVELHVDHLVYVPAAKRYEELVLRVLTSTDSVKTLWEIRQRTGPLSIEQLRRTLNHLAKTGKLVKKTLGHNCAYRLPLSVGVEVVENKGTKSQRLGVVDSMQLLRSANEMYPVVLWMNGSRSFSSEVLLEPIDDLELKRILRQLPPNLFNKIGFREIPIELFEKRAYTTRGTIAAAWLNRIAAYLELTGSEYGRITHKQRNELLDYLDYTYPGWRDERAIA